MKATHPGAVLVGVVVVIVGMLSILSVYYPINGGKVSNSTISSRTTATGILVSGTGSPILISSIETGDTNVRGAPRLIAVDANSSRIYVTDWFSENLTVVDAATHSVIDTIVLPGSSNSGIAIDYTTNTIYVSVSGCINRVNVPNSCDSNPPPAQEGGIVEIDGATNKIVSELRYPVGVEDLAFDSATHTLYGYSNRLLGIDVRTGSVVANLSLSIWASGIVVDPHTNTVFVVGCSGNGLVCDSGVAIVNGTTENLRNVVHLGFGTYPRVTLDTRTDVAYVTGDAQLVALSGITGKVIYDVRTGTCAVIDGLATNPSTNQVLATSLELNYTLAFDESNGMLSNMFTSPGEPQFVAFNQNTQEIYVTLFSGRLLAFHNVINFGHVNGSLIGPGSNCPLP